MKAAITHVQCLGQGTLHDKRKALPCQAWLVMHSHGHACMVMHAAETGVYNAHCTCQLVGMIMCAKGWLDGFPRGLTNPLCRVQRVSSTECVCVMTGGRISTTHAPGGHQQMGIMHCP